MTWDRNFWAIYHSSRETDGEFLVGQAWLPMTDTRKYRGEPSRVALFSTRALARDACAEMQKRLGHVKGWHFRVVRVRELVEQIADGG